MQQNTASFPLYVLAEDASWERAAQTQEAAGIGH
jgi:hypothetical protein